MSLLFDDVQHKAISEMMRLSSELIRVHGINAELLEALKTIMGDAEHGQGMQWSARCKMARAAIAKAEGRGE